MSLLSLFLVLMGFVALTVGADFLVRGASRLALAFGITPLVVGLTVVAFGTSAPEAAVSVWSVASGEGGIAVGNVVGSNIFNILFVLGLSALVAPLIVSQQLVRLEVPILIGVSVIFFAMSLDGQIDRLDGGLLFTGVIIYTIWAIRRSRREKKDIADEYEAEFGDTKAEGSLPINLAWTFGGILLLIAGSRVLVTGAVDIAEYFKVSKVIIGLTIISVGTSLPEVATSVIASIKGERDIAVGNAIGSNLFNIMAVFGLTGLVAPAGVVVAETVLRFDMPVMIAVAAAILPIFFSGHLIRRWEGGLMFAYYWIYLAFLILTVVGHPSVETFGRILVIFVLPLTTATLIFTTWQAWRTPVNPE